jgi:hypothetical protein
MCAERLRTVAALQRFLREYDDIPAREASKHLARGALAVLVWQPCLDRRCRMKVRELLALPAENHPGGRRFQS